MVLQQVTLTTGKKFAELNKGLFENKKQNFLFVQDSYFHFLSVLSQLVWNAIFNHGYTPQLKISFRKGNVLPTQTNTLTHTP